MNAKNKLILFVVLTAGVIINISCFDFLPGVGVCENSTEKEAISPNGKRKVVIFNRGCGATVGFITGISVFPVDEKIDNNDTGNILSVQKVYREFSTDTNGQTQYGETNFDVEWISDKELLVYYSEPKQIYKQEIYQDIKIRYKLFTE